MTSGSLFEGGRRPDDHRWFSRMQDGASETATALRAFAEETHAAHRGLLDDNFARVFRSRTPEHFSELFYLAALVHAGFVPLPRVTRFDLAFQLAGGHRLLVEVVTPAPPERLGEYEERDGFTFCSFGPESRDAALLRLTSAFWSKAKIIDRALREGHARAGDYKVVAISGLRLSQEGEWGLEGFGNPPDFAAAFLPIGSLEIPIALSRDPSIPPRSGSARYAYSDTIRREPQDVERDAFLSGRFSQVDAVAYTDMELSNVRAERQIGVLHNPTSSWPGPRPIFGLGADYYIESTAAEFSIRRVPALGESEPQSA